MMILDEPTEGLDSATEATVHAAPCAPGWQAAPCC